MWDASADESQGETAEQIVVDQDVTGAGAKATAVLRPDDAFLLDPDTVYPVTIDPGVSWSPSFDTRVALGASTDFSQSNQLRIGKDSNGQISRSFITFNQNATIQGQPIISATLNLYNVLSGSCSRYWQVFRADPVSPATRWPGSTMYSTTTGVTTTQSVAAPGCGGANWVQADFTPFAEYFSQTGTDVVTIGLTTNEADSTYYKAFYSGEAGSNIPRVDFVWNRPPDTPGSVSVTLCGTCGPDYWVTQYVNPSLSAYAYDGDGPGWYMQYQFQVFTGPRPGVDPMVRQQSVDGVSGVTVWYQTNLGDGHYWYRTRAWDGFNYSPWQDETTEFIIDSTPSIAPNVSSDDWPRLPDASDAGVTGEFYFQVPEDDVDSFIYWFDDGGRTSVPAYGTNDDQAGCGSCAYGPATLSPGVHRLHVQSVDYAGNISPEAVYDFTAGAVGVAEPQDGDRTARYTTISASALGYSYLQWEYRRGAKAAWALMPSSSVQTSSGAAVAWPMSGGTTPTPLTWDVPAAAGAASGLVQARACYDNTTAFTSKRCTYEVDIQLSSAGFGATYATENVGPGTVSLFNGDYAVSETDVDLGEMVIGRTATSLNPPTVASPGVITSTAVFGPGWRAALPGSSSGYGNYALTDSSAADKSPFLPPDSHSDTPS